MAEDSDAEDLIPLDEMPDGLIDYDGSASEDEGGIPPEDEEWTGFGNSDLTAKKRKRGEDEGKNEKRKKRRSIRRVRILLRGMVQGGTMR